MMTLSGQATLLTYNTAQFLTGTQPGDNTGGQGPDFGKASPFALLVLIVLFIAVGFLIRSMTKHLRKVPASFDKQTQSDAHPGEQAATERSATEQPAVEQPKKDTTTQT